MYDAASGEVTKNVSAQRISDLCLAFPNQSPDLWPRMGARDERDGGDAGAFGFCKPAAWACSKPATMGSVNIH